MMNGIFKHALVALALTFPLAPYAQKISADPTASALAGGEYLAGVQSGANVKILPSQILTYALANLHKINAQTGTSYALVAADSWKHVTFSNASAQAVTIAQAGTTGFANGYGAFIEVLGAGTVTITPTTSTINGSSSLALTSGQAAILFSDGTNYRAVIVNPAFTGGTLTSLLNTVATATGGAGFRLPHGTAPTSPTNGDLWTTTAGLYARINGATVGPFSTGSGGTPAGSDTYVQYNASGSFGAEAAFTYNATTDVLTVKNITSSANGKVVTAAATTSNAGLNLPAGAAPTSPVDGDLWTTTSGLYARINGSTVGPYGAAGSSLTNWTEAVGSSAPNATIPVVSFAPNNAATNADAAIVPKGTGALTAQVADNSTSGGNKRGSRAVDFQMSRASITEVASATGSTVGGGQRNTASANGATVPGGTNNAATGADAFSVGNGNTSSGQTSTTAGSTNTASGTDAGSLGTNNVSSGAASFAVGANNTADADNSFATGKQAKVRGVVGARVHASGQLAIAGDAQEGFYPLHKRTTNATPIALTTDAAAATTNNQVIIPSDGAFKFRAECAAMVQSTGDASGWTIIGLAKNTSSTLSLVGTPTVTKDFSDSGASAWAMSVSADNTNKAIGINVTGAASTNISWFCSVWTAQVRGA